MKYCEKIYQTQRWKTRDVRVGSVGVGGDNPIRIQSMTTSDTRDVQSTVAQIIRLADSGCEIARVTVQGMKEADACEEIKNELIAKGYTIPIVADIHFYPPAALRVVDFADKVRINPGNFVDRRASFKTIIYDDKTYQEELERLDEKFSPLVEKCKKLKKALRIGTNHGSLSDRIMNRYGDTPVGMVESALEFARVCRKLDFHDIIFSMKASNPQIMIQAYRMLVAQMICLNWNYPLHLGVTEAGEGDDGRVKSAIGIGSLLMDGLGDTIRVSLTEDPWSEIDPCKRLVKFAEKVKGQGVHAFSEKHRKIDVIQRREVELTDRVLHRDGSVFLFASNDEIEKEDFFSAIGCQMQFKKPVRDQGTVDAILIEGPISEASALKINQLESLGIGIYYQPNVIDEDPSTWTKELGEFVLFSPKQAYLHHSRRFFDWIQDQELKIPVILQFAYDIDSEDDCVIHASSEYGSLLCDGLGEGIALRAPLSLAKRRSLSFAILQGARMRQSKTDFISCPGCGRTLFDLQAVAHAIRLRTSHLPGVKIAIMGCIVNGPGEMADADFGYVGSAPGKIDLYKGKTRVQKNIEFDDAVESLVNLIKENGRWVEPAVEKYETIH